MQEKNTFFAKKSKKICIIEFFVVSLHPLTRFSDNQKAILHNVGKMERLPCTSLFIRIASRSRAVVARQAHNLKVGGSIPSSATQPQQAAFFI